MVEEKIGDDGGGHDEHLTDRDEERRGVHDSHLHNPRVNAKRNTRYD